MVSKVKVTAELLGKMTRGKANKSNLNSVVVALNQFGEQAGLLLPHRLAKFLGQVMHESGNFRYDKEIWGPTAAQKRYEGRKDLGNTQPGDGKKFMGRTGMQITGRHNTTKFWKYALKLGTALGITVPDFTQTPDAMNKDPWEGLGPIWYWDEGNPEGKSLNKYADTNNIYMITQRINGGQNGAQDRRENTIRASLVLLGYGTTEAEIKRFQKDRGLTTDGVVGNNTFMELHVALGGKNPDAKTVKVKVDKPVAIPVPEPVKVPDLDKPWYKSKEGLTNVATGPIGTGVVAWLTDIPTEKIILLVGIAVIGFGGWFVFRKINAQKQEAAAETISQDANTAFRKVQQRAVEANREVMRPEEEAS